MKIYRWVLPINNLRKKSKIFPQIKNILYVNKVMALTFKPMVLNRTWFILIIRPEDILV